MNGALKEFTREELKEYNGQGDRPVYVAHGGKVYDVTSSSMWTAGEHEAVHSGGEDLTEQMGSAPHGEEVLDGFPVVGRLKD